MVTFTAFSNILPDPAHPISDAGSISSTGTPGPGFKAIGFSSVTDTRVSRTVSGRGVSRGQGVQYYEFTLSYNPMFREQFDAVSTFLEGRNPREDPFYVILPQHSRPKDPAFTALNTMVTVNKQEAGDSTVLVRNTAGEIIGKLRPGDMLNFNDPEDFNHQKIYKIARVETFSLSQDGEPVPGLDQFRLHLAPPIQRDISPGTKLVLENPKFRVIAKADVQSYELDTENLYAFSLAVEELQP